MSNDDIIRMAQDAGMTQISHVSTADLICTSESIERFANLVAAAEREACAKVCDELADDAAKEQDFHAIFACESCGSAIRERNQG